MSLYSIIPRSHYGYGEFVFSQRKKSIRNDLFVRGDVNELVIEAIYKSVCFGTVPTPISGEVFPQRFRFSKALVAIALDVFEQGVHLYFILYNIFFKKVEVW